MARHSLFLPLCLLTPSLPLTQVEVHPSKRKIPQKGVDPPPPPQLTANRVKAHNREEPKESTKAAAEKKIHTHRIFQLVRNSEENLPATLSLC